MPGYLEKKLGKDGWTGDVPAAWLAVVAVMTSVTDAALEEEQSTKYWMLPEDKSTKNIMLPIEPVNKCLLNFIKYWILPVNNFLIINAQEDNYIKYWTLPGLITYWFAEAFFLTT